MTFHRSFMFAVKFAVNFALNFALNFTVAFIFAASWAQAQVVKVDLQKDLRTPFQDLYQGTEKSGRGLSGLSQLKKFQIQLNWSQCNKIAPSVFASNKDLQGWIAVTWLYCLQQEQKKKANPAFLRPALDALEKERALFISGPWAPSLMQSWIELRLIYLDDQVRQKKRVVAALDRLLSPPYSTNKEHKAKIYQLLGDTAVMDAKFDEAQFFFDQAQDQNESVYVQERLDFVIRAQGFSPTSKLSPTAAAVELSPDVQLEERIQAATQRRELISALQDSMRLLNEYPGSRTARRLKDRPLEIYNSLSDPSAKTQALKDMATGDGARILEWAQGLHRRGDFMGSWTLARRAFEKSPTSAGSTSALWIVGRSAHFLGNYSEALESYRKLISFHPGSEEAAEALFRSSLIHYRQKEYSNASALLEKLLSQGRERYDLNGKYWLVRCLQMTNPERAKVEATALIARYPFTYYGLRLSAEAQGGLLKWPEALPAVVPLKTEFFLVGEQKKSWQRFKLLSQAGWVSEAQAELNAMPVMKDPTLKISMAKKLSEQGQYMAAIRLLNEAMEADPRLRREEFLTWGYPRIFTSLYKVEAERYGLDVSLLLSLTRQESGFNLRAVSTSNALGLMQMIPPTAQEVARKLGLSIELPDDMFRPEVNIPMGSFYISQMIDQFEGHIPLALAAYNAGPHRLKQFLKGRPELAGMPSDEIWFDELPWSETSFYVKAILRNILLYRLVDEGNFTLKPVLWLDLRNKKAK